MTYLHYIVGVAKVADDVGSCFHTHHTESLESQAGHLGHRDTTNAIKITQSVESQGS